MDEIEQVCANVCDYNDIMLTGDMNIDICRKNAHSRCMEDLAERHGLLFGKNHRMAKYEHTYVNEGAGHYSCIDHYIVPKVIYDGIIEIKCLDNSLNVSKHMALMMKLNIKITKLATKEMDNVKRSIAWKRVNDEQICKYKTCVKNGLRDIQIPEDAVLCNDVNCQNEEHRNDISIYCKGIIDVCIKSGDRCFPRVKSKKYQMPYWNETVEPLKSDAKFWHSIWVSCGKPQDGAVTQIMRNTKHKYHYAIRKIKKNEDVFRNSRMAESIIDNGGQRQIWDELKKMNSANRLPPRINEATTSKEINDVFTHKYKDLYNSVPSDPVIMTEINEILNDKIRAYEGRDHVITATEMKKAVSKLRSNKSDGSHGLWSNHLIYAPDDINVHLSILATAMVVHGFNPYDLLIGTLVSLPKDKHGDLCDSDNYRGICLCSCINKLIEWCFLTRYSDILSTSGLQFSFKAKHSTVMCTLVKKEIVNYYWNNGSNVYGCSIDASKAFDRIRYDRLFQLLIGRGLPPVIVRLLLDMYQRQLSRTFWNNEYGTYFGSINGVRQGGVISPVLFTVYMDELLTRLQKSGLGCHIGHEYYGSLGYADDMELLCPSVKGMQRMINICTQFGDEYGVKYNAGKTMCIKYERKSRCNGNSNDPVIMMGDERLKWVKCIKQLGSYISHDLSEAEEIRIKRNGFIGKVNGILIRFKDTKPDVKCFY